MPADTGDRGTDGAAERRHVVLLRDRAPRPRGQKPAQPVVRVLLVEPRPLIAGALKRSLEGTCGGVRFAVRLLDERPETSGGGRPDAVLLHAHAAAPFDRCIDRVRAMLGSDATPIVVYSDEVPEDWAQDVLAAGAAGVLPFTLETRTIVHALDLVRCGLAVLPREAVARLAGGDAARCGRAAAGSVTRRELEIIRRVRGGKPNKVIAYELGMTESTVKVHMRSIFRKLGAHNRTEVAMIGGRLLSSDDRAGG
jgi:DNA-binding NarL/FixJ family response regulator